MWSERLKASYQSKKNFSVFGAKGGSHWTSRVYKAADLTAKKRNTTLLHLLPNFECSPALINMFYPPFFLVGTSIQAYVLSSLYWWKGGWYLELSLSLIADKNSFLSMSISEPSSVLSNYFLRTTLNWLLLLGCYFLFRQNHATENRWIKHVLRVAHY